MSTQIIEAMRVAYFELIGGAAGDMIIGSLLDVGLSLEDLQRELAKLPLAGYHLRCERVSKSGLAATQLSVEVEGHHHHDPHRLSRRSGPSVDDVVELISKSGLDGTVKGTSREIFEALASAAHAKAPLTRELRFDPVDVVDSVVDIVGAVAGLHHLGVRRIYCSPFPIFYGTIATRHGPLKIPVAETVELLASSGAPVARSPVPNVQVTPTGAAILTTLAVFRKPVMTVEREGCGAGQADLTIPNVVQVSVGNAAPTDAEERKTSD